MRVVVHGPESTVLAALIHKFLDKCGVPCSMDINVADSFETLKKRVRGAKTNVKVTAEETPNIDFRWQDHLEFDEEVSEHSPVVKGTWVTVGHVVSLIVDGWTWSDILKTHPELCEDDIRACLSYEEDYSLAAQT